MAMASYGEPRDPRARCGELVRADGDGGFATDAVDWDDLAPRLVDGDAWTPQHAELACERPDAAARRCCWSWPGGCTRGPGSGG